jgi:uncharacterized sulfatase
MAGALRCAGLLVAVGTGVANLDWLQGAERPNVLIAISDDQSFPYASAYGCTGVSTPAFDRVARAGVLFTNGFAASPGCSPSRAALLTGLHCWQLEHAATHASWFPTRFTTFPERLQAQGYFVGHTGKGWGPGRHEGREHNPAGPSFSRLRHEPAFSGISATDYAANFAEFLKQKPAETPFCFWYGATEPHRGYERDAWRRTGKQLAEARVPGYLPDTPEVRADILDYCVEIEHFDTHLGRMLDLLEQQGELDNTLVIVTADNGMSFPRAKANCYEAGVHVPLAISWPERAPGGRVVDDVVGFVDLTATVLEASGVALGSIEPPLVGHSLLATLESEQSGTVDAARTGVFSSRERHSSSRYQNLGYPQRAMRTPQFLYIRNFRPDRWPAGAPETLSDDGRPRPPHSGYHDIDGCPTLSFLVENRDDPTLGRYLHLAVDHRPDIELFDIRQDPDCLTNLAGRPESADLEARLRRQFEDVLVRTRDPRQLDGGDIFETYRRYSGLRNFPPPADVVRLREDRERDGWRELFSGRDLTGWRASPPADSFEVVNGMILAHATSAQSHLFYVGDVAQADFRNFELLYDGLATTGSNGGLYFHTSFQEQDFPNDGHEVQLNSSHSNRTRTGSLFGVVDLPETAAVDNVFSTFHVTVRGRHVVIEVDGRKVVDYTEPEGYRHPRYTGRDISHGTFALQAHDPGSETYYRNIWVRPLP